MVRLQEEHLSSKSPILLIPRRPFPGQEKWEPAGPESTENWPLNGSSSSSSGLVPVIILLSYQAHTQKCLSMILSIDLP